MPTIPQSELPIPKSWDEFEHIVCDLYSRTWNDPHAQRHGRTGQPQQGVDIYGQPSGLGGRYVGIQCKRYNDGRLTRTKIEAEIAKAARWARTHGRVVTCNEFGVHRPYAPPGDVVQWHRDVCSALSRHGFGWTKWELDSSFGFFSRENGKLVADPELTRAMGLNVEAVPVKEVK